MYPLHKTNGQRQGFMLQHYNIHYTYRVLLHYTILKKETGMTYLLAMGHAPIPLVYNVLACKIVQFVIANDF